jgi:hypothetical protein
MPTPIDPKRLPQLKAALKSFGPGEKAPQQELAKIYGVSNARLTTLIHERFENFPPPERHEDKTHWYEAARAIESMIAYHTGRGARKRAAAKRVAAVLGEASAEAGQAKAEVDDDPPMTPAEIDKLASAATRTFRLEQEKRNFIRIEIARGYVRSLFNTVQRGVSSLPLEVDPNGELPVLARARLEAAVRDSMVRIHASVRDLIGDAEPT